MDYKQLALYGARYLARYTKVGRGAERAKGYYDQAKRMLDEDQRDGEVVRMGEKWAMAKVSELLDVTITEHPYYALHGAHMKVMIAVINALKTKDLAEKAFEAAVGSAKNMQVLARQVAGHRSVQHHLSTRFPFLAVRLEAQYGQIGTNGTGLTKMQADPALGEQWEETRRMVHGDRCAWIGLNQSAMTLWTMAAAEKSTCEEAARRYLHKRDQLKHGKNTFAGLTGAVMERDQTLNHAMDIGASTPTAELRPVTACRHAFQQVDQMSKKLHTYVDAIMDDALLYHRPRELNARLLAR